ncbi:glycosyltransferase family 2 protein [Patescibacteria group bacterium]
MKSNSKRVAPKSTPLVSIVIVAGPKRKKELLNCLLSIEKSSYKRYEAIVVDNSQSPKLKTQILTQYPQTKYIVMPHNVGVLGYNIGLINAKGDYILTLDDDCTINPDTLKNIVSIFAKKPKKVAVLATNLYEPPSQSFAYESYLNHKTKKLLTISNASVFRKDVFTKTGFFDADLFLWVHEDDLAIRIIDNNMEIHFEPKIIVNHHLEKNRPFRKKMAFFLCRNLAWFNYKHFSWYFIPLMIIRNLITIILMPVKRKVPQALFYCLAGYLIGLLSFATPLKKRKVVKKQIQKKYLRFYFLNKL